MNEKKSKPTPAQIRSLRLSAKTFKLAEKLSRECDTIILITEDKTGGQIYIHPELKTEADKTQLAKMLCGYYESTPWFLDMIRESLERYYGR